MIRVIARKYNLHHYRMNNSCFGVVVSLYVVITNVLALSVMFHCYLWQLSICLFVWQSILVVCLKTGTCHKYN